MLETSKYLWYFTTPSYLCNRHKTYMGMSLYRYYTKQLVFSRFIEAKKMEKNMPEREDFDEVESKEIAVDFEDAIVQSVDGVIVQGDDEEIKLLFFYVKPESDHDEDNIQRCKCVAEFRVSRSRFMDIARDINIKVTDIDEEREKISMFA